MKIKSVYIKNYKAYERKTINLCDNSLILGENDSGKSTILEALNIFFNDDKIEKVYIRDILKEAEIGILIEDKDDLKFIKKTYSAKTYKHLTTLGDVSILNSIRYIFISSNTIDVKKLISDLAISKTLNLISTDESDNLLSKMNSGVNEVLSSIDSDLLVVNSNSTKISSRQTLKLESAFKFEILSEGIPIEGRGSGFRKTLVYSLLTKSSYENVIIGIDEIENSLSIKNASELIKVVNSKFMQSLITTHSTAVVSCVNSCDLVPIPSDECKTLSELITKLGNVSTDKSFVLVEGKTDMIWINRVLSLLKAQDDFIVIQCGGCENIAPVYNELIAKSFNCHIIKDGDTKDIGKCLSKDCIEMYVPLEYFNTLFCLSETAIPNNKNDFFNTSIDSKDDRSYDWVKNKLADNVDSFLTIDNPLVDEIKELLSVK